MNPLQEISTATELQSAIGQLLDFYDQLGGKVPTSRTKEFDEFYKYVFVLASKLDLQDRMPSADDPINCKQWRNRMDALWAIAGERFQTASREQMDSFIAAEQAKTADCETPCQAETTQDRQSVNIKYDQTTLPAEYRDSLEPDGGPLVPTYVKKWFGISSSMLTRAWEKGEIKRVKMGRVFAYCYQDLQRLPKRDQD